MTSPGGPPAGGNPTPAWQDVISLLPDGVLVVDEDDEIVFVSPQLVQLTGYPADELVGQRVSLLMPEAAWTRPSAFAADSHRDDTPRCSEVSVHTKDGTTVPVEVRLRPVAGSDGSRHLLSVVRDLRSRTAWDDLWRISEEAFRTAFEHAPIGVCVAEVRPDGSRSIRMANQALAGILGTTVDELRGRSLSEYTSEEDPALAFMFKELVSGKRAEITTLTRFRRSDSVAVWAEKHARMFALPGDNAALVLGHVVDVTGFIAQQARLSRTARLQGSISEVTTAALVGELTPELLQRIAVGASSTLGGDGAVLVLGVPGSDRWRLEAAHGTVLESLAPGIVFARMPDVLEELTEETLRLPEPPEGFPEALAAALGPVAVSRFEPVDGKPGGYLAVARRRGGEEFTEWDVEDLRLLAEQTRMALQLSWARRDQQRLALIEDRQRIARELHDIVIQDLIALGMELVTAAEQAPDETTRRLDLDRVTRLETAVRQLRRVVFELRVPERQDPSQAIENLVADAGRVMGHVPQVVLDGPVDSLPDDVTHDILGVLREALSNVARHATASRTTAHLTVDRSRVTLLVEDDGNGMPVNPRLGHGIPNIRQRAAARQGRAEISASTLGGTRLLWSCQC